MIFSTPSSPALAAKFQREPRYLQQLLRRNAAALRLPGAGAGISVLSGLSEAALLPKLGVLLAPLRKAKLTPTPQPDPAGVHRDWGMSLASGGQVGNGQFPAKYTFDINATPSCTNDFVACNTSTVAASSTGTFTNNNASNGQTATIAGSLVLTASSTLNTGVNFQIGGGATNNATNLAAAIARNGSGVGVTATSSAGVVTVTATTPGTTANGTTLAEGLSGFSWAGSLAGGSGPPAAIVAIDHLYATQGGNCLGSAANGTGPALKWAYKTTNGTPGTSAVLSLDGTKVAFVETGATGSTGATLRLLKWKSGEGTLASPVSPTTTLTAGQSWSADCPAANSCMRSIAFGQSAASTNSPPFPNYATDTIYVGDDGGAIHKFTGVFQRNACRGDDGRLAADGALGSHAHRGDIRFQLGQPLRRRQHGARELRPRGRQHGWNVRIRQPALSRQHRAEPHRHRC